MGNVLLCYEDEEDLNRTFFKDDVLLTSFIKLSKVVGN